jgi:hypothetical protein
VSESGGLGFLERDQAAGELQQGEVVLGFLRPADQQGAVAVEPGVAGFDDPAAGAPPWARTFELEFVAAAADVGAVAATRGELVDPGVAVAAIEAEPLRLLG